jgi:hypothetical protein
MDRAEAKHGNDEESESEAAVRRAALLSGRVRHGAAATQKMHDDRSLKDLGTKMSEIHEIQLRRKTPDFDSRDGDVGGLDRSPRCGWLGATPGSEARKSSRL